MKTFKEFVENKSKDIIITLPAKISWYEYQKELVKAEDGEIMNFKVNHLPKQTQKGCKCYLLHQGQIKGYMIICGLKSKEFTCSTTGKKWKGNFIQRTGEFYLIKTIPMKGFQGYRYYENI